MKIDAFTHILPPHYYQTMLELAPDLPERFPFLKIQTLTNLEARLAKWPDPQTRQIIFLANISPEDFADPRTAAQLCIEANQELADLVRQHRDKFAAAVAVLPMNNLDAALEILAQINSKPFLAGAQIFTRHLGQSIAAGLSIFCLSSRLLLLRNFMSIRQFWAIIPPCN